MPPCGGWAVREPPLQGYARIAGLGCMFGGLACGGSREPGGFETRPYRVCRMLLLQELQARCCVPQVCEEIFHLADTPAGQVLAAVQNEEVGDLLPQALRIPDGGRDIRDVVLRADHGQHPGDAYGAEVVEANSVLEENGLRSGAAWHAWRVAFDRLYDRLAGLRGEVPVLEYSVGHKRRALGVVGRLPPRVGLVEPYVVQKGSRAQYLLVVGDVLHHRELLGQGVDPQTVGVPVDRMCPHPGNERLYLLHHRFHGGESSE